MRYEMREDDHTQSQSYIKGHVQNINILVNLKNIKKYKLMCMIPI